MNNKNKSKQNTKSYSNHYGENTASKTEPAKTNNTPPPKSLGMQQKMPPVDYNKPVTLRFNAIDTLFFRESRPMESMGELQSVFPPPVRTLAGAVRSLIGETLGIQWNEFSEKHPHAAIIGYGEKLGNLRLKGAWLAWEGKRLYPAPLHILKKDNNFFQLNLAQEGTWCDLGRCVRLPKLPESKSEKSENNPKGSKPLENTWLTYEGLVTVLAGNTPTKDQIKNANELFERESRLGIARDNATGTVQKSMLYQTQHIRPKAELSIELDVTGLAEDYLPNKGMLRLGGEGRSASVEITSKIADLPAGKTAETGIALYLLTPLPINWNIGSGENWQPLPGFKRVQPDDITPNKDCKQSGQITTWRGELNGIELELHGAVVGKAIREGGWDMAAHKPRAVTSLIPAGSVFFCKILKGNAQDAIKALHDKNIGTLTEYGYGHLAVGVWKDQ